MFEHTLAALAVQAGIGRLSRNWWLGAALASGYFVGRELAQAEYRWIEQFGAGLRANLPWWGALDGRVWPHADQWADALGPVIATGLVAALMHRRTARDASAAV